MPTLDSPWKEALHGYFLPFLAFFFPLILADIDETIFEEEAKMAFVSSFEKYGKEVWEKIYMEKGRRSTLLPAIELGLELKFGPTGLALMPEVQKVEDLAVLEAVFAAIRPATTVDDIRRLLPAAGIDSA